jgi:hypothetical protein
MAASRLGEAGININYAYCGAEAGYCSATRRDPFNTKGRGRKPADNW